MAFVEEWIPGMLVGAALAIVAPAALKASRPVTKTMVKTGLILTDRIKEGVAETQEQWSDMVAEARAELEAEAEQASTKANPDEEKPTSRARQRKTSAEAAD